MKVQIEGKKYEAHFNLRAQMMWEQYYDKKFNPVTIEEVFCYYYLILHACNELDGDECTFDWFLKAIENDPSIVNQLVDAITVKKKRLLQRMKLAWRVMLG